MEVSGQKDFVFGGYGGASGMGGGFRWYAPAGTDRAFFAAQLIAQAVDEPTFCGDEPLFKNCSFKESSRSSGAELFGLEWLDYMGSFTCQSDWECPGTNSNYFPDHHFRSGVKVWIWSGEGEALYKGFSWHSAVIKNPLIFIAISLVPMACGACFIRRAFTTRKTAKQESAEEGNLP